MTHVSVRTSGTTWQVALDRPEKRNALSPEMIKDLHRALDDAEAARATAFVLSGNGSMFCAGADIAGYSDAADDPAALEAFTDRARGFCTRLAQSPVVVVAAVGGTALGGGFELVLGCDIVVSTADARFGLPELRLGLIPGWGGTQRLTQRIGLPRASRAILLGETFAAEELHRAGLVSTIVQTRGELDAAVADLAARLADTAPLAASAAKEAIRLAADPASGSFPGMDRERELLLDLFASADGREGVLAFVEKRAPSWTGS